MEVEILFIVEKSYDETVIDFNFGRHKDLSIFGEINPHVYLIEVSKGAKIRNRYIQVPHPTKDTNGKATNSQ